MPVPHPNHPRAPVDRAPVSDRWQVGVVVAVLVMALAWIFIYATMMDEAPASTRDHVRFSQPLKSTTSDDVQSLGPHGSGLNTQI